MRYGLNDAIVKRIAAVAYHASEKKAGSYIEHLSAIFNNLLDTDVQQKILGADNLNAMKHVFSDKDDETVFKTYLAKASAINRGTLDPIPVSADTDKSQEPRVRGEKGAK